MNRRNFIHCAGVACLALMLPGCYPASVAVGPQRSGGPPPHAPAHGYRRKNQDGLEMRFDSGLGVYVVLNHPLHFFWNSLYYRKRGNQWETSRNIHKKWKRIKKQKLPKGLKNK